jgi:hypothetical protein
MPSCFIGSFDAAPEEDVTQTLRETSFPLRSLRSPREIFPVSSANDHKRAGRTPAGNRARGMDFAPPKEDTAAGYFMT